MNDSRRIRNFCIIAHIDHGKSTLADRMLEVTKTISERNMRNQYLDQMDLERERGITIKMQPVRMLYDLEAKLPSGSLASKSTYVLNLIDTPGHIDFNYEVSRALLAVEGAVLLVDATQGVQAQTIANVELAQKNNLVIIPAINKIDLPEARIDESKEEIVELLGCDPDEIVLVSAKTGDGVRAVLDAVVEKIPFPSLGKTSDVHGTSDVEERPFQALIFDSQYSTHKGVLAYVRVFQGSFQPKRGAFLKLFNKDTTFEPTEVGIFNPALVKVEQLSCGEIGYIATNLKDPLMVRVGDTIGNKPVAGYKEPHPMVWASIYPEHADEFEKMKDSFLKLRLNDPALSFEVEGSQLLGRSLRVGFLGMLHLEITIERLMREFGVSVIIAQPSVEYRLVLGDGLSRTIRDAESLSREKNIQSIYEPWFSVFIVSRISDLGPILELLQKNEGEVRDTKSLAGARILIGALVPLRKLVTNFFDDLKSTTQGYGSLSYELAEERPVDLVILSILIAEDEVPQFARLLPERDAEYEARKAVEKLYTILPKQLFPLKIQAALGGRILASRTLPALAKNVTAKLYGGDRSRKMKLWKKQKEGKKRLRSHAEVDIPHQVYLKMIGR